ncbi:MFS transporter [Deinococcus sedimenti]|uniref:MFS transporter n=1 Tax=Deinococcus sedimenti TaxID=1867090 RepID=UPI0016685DD9|nr:MFS transporter [Deinococcus sedimenti]
MAPLTGLRGYTVIWTGQFFSSLGAGMTTFALALWLWEETHRATAFSLLTVVTFAPLIVLTPLVGALVDRWNGHLKRVMMIGDAARLLTSVLLLALLLGGHLSPGWLYAVVLLEAVTGAFQWPADSAATTVMLRPEDYARAGGIQTAVTSLSAVLAPPLGALLYHSVGLSGLVTLDLLGGALALTSLLLVRVPNPPVSDAGRASRSNLWRESLYGFRFILAHPALLTLQLVFLFGNLLNGLTFTLQTPLILARSGESGGAAALAAVQMAAGLSGVASGLIIAAWGGPKRRLHGVLIGWAVSFGTLLLLGAGPSLPFWMLAAVIGAFSAPLTNSSNQALWQTRTPADIQGKVFAARRVIAMLALPAAAFAAGPLADRVLTPATAPGGTLAGVADALVPAGGAGIALLYLLVGVTGVTVMLAMFTVPRLRAVEHPAPDEPTDEPTRAAPTP